MNNGSNPNRYFTDTMEKKMTLSLATMLCDEGFMKSLPAGHSDNY